MSEASSKRRRFIAAIVASVVVLGAVCYLWRIGGGPVVPVRQTQPPLAGTTRPDTTPQPLPAASTVDGLDVAQVVNQATEEIRPIEWQELLWDGQSKSSPETLEKAKAISRRFFDNFAEINSLKLHNEVVAEGLGSGKDLDIVQLKIANLKRSLYIEVSREPLFCKVSGIYASKPLESMVTPIGKTQKGDGIGFAESLVPSYLDGGAIGFTRHNLGAELVVVEDVRPDSELLNLPVLKEYNLDPDARYDVLARKNPDTGGVFSFWFNRETGMIDYKLHTKPEHADDENPYVSVMICRYKQAGDIVYPALIDTWMVSSILEKPLPRDFQLRYTSRFTGVEINEIPVE